MTPAGLATDSANTSLIQARADARAAIDAERAERATTITMTTETEGH